MVYPSDVNLFSNVGDGTLYCVSPRYRLSTFGRLRVFTVAGRTSWTALPDRLRDPPVMRSDSFRPKYLKLGIICGLLNTIIAVKMLHDAAP